MTFFGNQLLQTQITYTHAIQNNFLMFIYNSTIRFSNVLPFLHLIHVFEAKILRTILLYVVNNLRINSFITLHF